MNLTSTTMFCLDPDYLDDLANKYSEAYTHAQPFSHIIIDNFLPESVLNRILEEFPKPGEINWRKFNLATEKKLASSSELQMGDATRLLLYQLNSATFINFLERLTGIDGIIPDPHFIGGGLHQTERGGYLKIHADFNRHKKLHLDRRLNLLIYLNKDWQEEYGGQFEMWDRNMTACAKKILPIFNRCVVFSTTDFSYHGLPDPITCPEGWTRKSLALYYYSNGRPPEEISDEHSTLFKARNEGEIIKNKATGMMAKTFIKKLIPPIIFDLKKSLAKK